MAIVISPRTLRKLGAKHQVSEQEVEQCFENLTGLLLIDSREDHRTNPPTLWFLALTNKRRLLKVCYVQDGNDQIVKTVYVPNETEVGIYRRRGGTIGL